MPRWGGKLDKVDEYRWRIPKSYKAGMRVPGLIYADEGMLQHILEEQAPEQVANVAFLPGIVGNSLAMPDIHWGYGFAIGGVAAMRMDDGVISPGGVGFDINCGVRILRTNLTQEEVQPKIKELIDRVKKDNVKEVIIATDFTTEGETTALYLFQVLKPLNVKVTRLARGVPAGASIEHADIATLERALEERKG